MSAEKHRPVKDEVVEDSDSDDDIPIAIAAKKKQHQQPPPPKKEPKQEPFADGDASLRDLKKKKVKDAPGSKKEIANGDLKPIKEEKKSSNVKPSKVKKEEDDAYDTPSLKKKKKIKEELKRVKEELINTPQKPRKPADGKREKKVYSLPGQKHDPPPERDPLRIFYESLYEQVPNSEMAAIWMMEWGLLPAAVAAKVFEKKKARQLLPKSPAKSVVKSVATTEMKKSAKVMPKEVKKELSVKTVTKTTTVKKRKAGDTSSDEGDDDDDDFMPLSLKKAKKKLKMSD